jgi:hypothetical protein
MKSVGHGGFSSGGHSFNQIPIPDDFSHPPFKPLGGQSSYNAPFEIANSPSSAYLPTHYSTDYAGHSSNESPIAVNPKAYDTYHSMLNKMKKEQNFVTLPTLTDSNDNNFLNNFNILDGYEIQKSFEYDLNSRKDS